MQKPTSLTETSTALAADLPEDSNITDLVLSSQAEAPHAPVYAVPNGAGGWLDVSFSAFLDQVRSVARGLIARGVEPGDRVAIFAPTSYEWAVLDQAIWFAGAISVPIYETSSAHQVEHILSDSGTTLVACGTASHEKTTQRAALDGGLEVSTFQLSGAGLDELTAGGTDVDDATLEAARSAADLDDVASLVYTSGTTGKPKGAMITHRNFAAGGLNVLAFAHEVVAWKESGHNSRTLMFLPLAHVLAHAVQVICLVGRIQIAHTPSMGTLTRDLASFRPNWLLAVPRVFEKLEAGVATKAKNAGQEKVFDAARTTAIAYSKAQEDAARGTGSGPSLALRAKRAVFDRLVFAKLRAALGGAVEYSVSGASALDPELAHFFRGAGLPIMEGYGLTETTAPATVNIPTAMRMGTVGLPVAGATVRISEDSEVLVKGPIVFKGYWENDQATAECFDDDGYFLTGDLGTLDEDGYLSIVGRKKELIVTAGGKNVYPTPMEEGLRRDRLVNHVVVVGENRPYVGALITLDPEALAEWCKDNGRGEMSMSEAAQDDQVRAAVQEAVDRINEGVSRAESIRKFVILDHELSEESGHVTQSMKLKRSTVMEDFEAEVEALYGPRKKA
ncbi:AMP-dependent synthetase/ligase [Micrococcus lylae]|uniref:Acyl-CoA synthetase n=1 Tax=Micrococcus lylae TaxID=1273 RepID=A0ABY2K212_9MICC|nr:AMP-dependent synthetase/ligase [Micrococcus lylae]TFI01176.1 long-chain fatty acid--CoA ligase [Micrococcus lylae]